MSLSDQDQTATVGKQRRLEAVELVRCGCKMRWRVKTHRWPKKA